MSLIETTEFSFLGKVELTCEKEYSSYKITN